MEQDPSLKDNLFNVHRLDRLTSGLTIVAKSTETAKVLGKCIMDRKNCHKIYLARVKGKFPLEAPMKDKIEIDGFKKAPWIHGEWSYDNEHPNFQDLNGNVATGFCFQNENDDIEKDKSVQNIFDAKIDLSKLTEDGKVQESLWLNLSVPVEITDPKNGVCEAGRPNGKSAQTLFAVVHYDEETDSTIVLAKPLTG